MPPVTKHDRQIPPYERYSRANVNVLGTVTSQIVDSHAAVRDSDQRRPWMVHSWRGLILSSEVKSRRYVTPY